MAVSLVEGEREGRDTTVIERKMTLCHGESERLATASLIGDSIATEPSLLFQLHQEVSHGDGSSI